MTDQAPDPNQLFMGSGARSAKFTNHKDEVWGTIMSSETRQQTDLGGTPKTFDNGNPMWQVVITLLTEQREDDDDDGLRAVYAKGQMLKAIGDAVRKAGEKGIEDGGKLFVRYVGDAEPTQRGFNGAKQYIAKYEPPTSITEIPDQPDDVEAMVGDAEPF
jgi:hypothetical protein